MLVNRRTALRQFLFVSAGVALLPSCLQDRSKSSILLKHFAIGGDQEQLLAGLAEAIIPTGATPGASGVSAHLFALKMLDDCYPKEDQQKFLKGLQQLDAAARAASGKSFVESSPAEKEALLAALERPKAAGQEINYCYTEFKRLTIQAYTSSSFFLTKIHVYELVPGRWHGCVPVNSNPNKVS